MVTLCDLGLSSYEERAYTALLELRSGTAEEISETCGVPMGRIYDVLKGLESRNLVRRQPDNRPRLYTPINPELAVSRLLDARKRDLEVEQTRYETIATELATHLGQQTPIDGRFWTAKSDAQEWFQLFSNRVSKATDQWLVTGTTIAGGLFGLEQIPGESVEGFIAALDRDVSVKILLTRTLIRELPESTTTLITHDIADHPAVDLRVADDVYNTIDLIDHTDFCVYVADPFDPQSVLGLTQIDDPDFVETVESAFLTKFERAPSVSHVTVR